MTTNKFYEKSHRGTQGEDITISIFYDYITVTVDGNVIFEADCNFKTMAQAAALVADLTTPEPEPECDWLDPVKEYMPIPF